MSRCVSPVGISETRPGKLRAGVMNDDGNEAECVGLESAATPGVDVRSALL
jgi:hypothetical protein